jgi:hypothetical protein
MTKELQKQNIRIFCNHCKNVVDSVWECKVDSVIGTRYIYICSNCKTNLGTYLTTNLLEENPSLRVSAVH